MITKDNVGDDELKRTVNSFLYGTADPCLNLKRNDISTSRAAGELVLSINCRHVDIIEDVFLKAILYRDALRECLDHLDKAFYYYDLNDDSENCEKVNGLQKEIKTMLGEE